MPSLQLTTLKLAHNRLAKKGLDAVLKAIDKAPQLEELDLSGTRPREDRAGSSPPSLDDVPAEAAPVGRCWADAEGCGALMWAVGRGDDELAAAVAPAIVSRAAGGVRP